MAEAIVERPSPAPPLRSKWRVGIVGHLALSFAAVGLLAALANFIVEGGVSIVEITRVEPVPITVAAPTAIEVETPIAEPPVVAANLGEQRSGVTEAVDRYGQAAIVRAQIANAENDERFAAAQSNLTAQQAVLARSLDERTRRTLDDALQAYRESGATLIGVADLRRQTIARYAERIESLRGLLDESVDKSWRIFGRVVARQTVLKLRTAKDQLQNAFTNFSAAGAFDPGAVAALIQMEEAFDATLAENERGLLRSEGREWLDRVRSEFHQLIALRAALVIDWQRLETVQLGFVQAGTFARERAAAIPDRVRPVVTQNAPRRPFVGPRLEDVEFVGPPLLDSVAPVALNAPEIRVARQETNQARRYVVAWASGAVLLIVLVISIATVRSIVVPIRRLLHATHRLGKEGTHERLPGGGIRELDTLAEAFNQMAEELVASRREAKEHQRLLEQRVMERTRELRQLAECDPLTGLPNRRHLLVLLEQALANAKLARQIVAVLFLDLDNFKNINDSMGHGFGDDVLKAIAERLKQVVVELGFAARLGGDEFTVVLTGAKNIDSVWATGFKVIEAFQKPLAIADRELTISVSVGASIYPDHEGTAEGLLKAADAALFRAKALGRSQLSVYTPELLAEAATRFTTEQGLRHAIERGDFELVFQPEVSVDSLQTELVEALVRWRMPDGRLASPAEFFAVAEESGLIAEIGDWVLRSAIAAAAEWYHGAWPQARVAINVSPRQLLDRRFVDRVQALLREFEVPPRCIELELTETVLQTGKATIDTLHRLHAAGIAIALDDFGTGYSSLASLEKLPFSRVKLDRSLIADIATSARTAAIARAIVRLCHDLKLEITAEGVETTEQLDVLTRYRPIYLQGYLLSKAVPASDLLATLGRLANDVPTLLGGRLDVAATGVLTALPRQAKRSN